MTTIGSNNLSLKYQRFTSSCCKNIRIRKFVRLCNLLASLVLIIPSSMILTKELSLWNQIKYLNLNIFRTRCCKPLIFQTQIIVWKYLRSATFGSKDIVIRKSEFVANTQFLYLNNDWKHLLYLDVNSLSIFYLKYILYNVGRLCF